MDRHKQHAKEQPASRTTSSHTRAKTRARGSVATQERGAEKAQRAAKIMRAPRETGTRAAATLSTTLAHGRDEMGHLLDALPDGVVIADEAGRIQLVNRQMESLFGYSAESLLGQPIEALLPERFRAVHPDHRADYGAKPHLRPMGTGLQLFGWHQDGTEFPVDICLSPITVGGTPLVLCSIRDVSAQRLLEQHAREELAGRLTVLQTVLDELPVGVYLAQGWDARLVLANRQMSAIWGAAWPEGQPLAAFIAASGSRVFDLQGRELPSERLATLQALRSGQSVRGQQEVIRHADGSILSILIDVVALDPHTFPCSQRHTETSGCSSSSRAGCARGCECAYRS